MPIVNGAPPRDERWMQTDRIGGIQTANLPQENTNGQLNAEPTKNPSNVTSSTRMNACFHRGKEAENETTSIGKPGGTGKIMPSQESRVKVIYTGGTIGMVRNENGVLAPKVDAFEDTLRTYPNLHDVNYALERFGPPVDNLPLVLPYSNGVSYRVIYAIEEYVPLLDSSNMTIDDSVRIAKDIREHYECFDAFVILHGTDTLAYTASILSFMLEDLGKTVILTGSQIPLFETRTDGKDNFTTALIIAGNFVIPEVCVVFGNRLMRGNRTVKISSNSLDAFDSPNFPPLGRIGINYDIDYRLIYRPTNISRFQVCSIMDVNVGILRLFPSITKSTFSAFLAPPMKGVVLQSFGSGNVPTKRPEILDEILAATKRGVIIVNITQCWRGSVAEIYATGQILGQLGVISGFDMTPEAAVAKLSYVIGKSEWNLEFKKKMLQSNIRGELTSPQLAMQEHDLIEAVARSLQMTSPEELKKLGNILYPAMLNSAVLAGDLNKIQNLKAYGADLSGTNEDNRTALHIACHEGKKDVVSILLTGGASVHIRDRHDRTALMEAVSKDYHNIISLLISDGAHLTGDPEIIGQELCVAAARGSVERLESYMLAKADVTLQDLSGRTALHVAALHGHMDCVKFLLEHSSVITKKDMLGMTAVDYAKTAGQTEIIEMISKFQK